MESQPDRIRDPAEMDYGELPELARALRALGSARRGGGSLQAQFFHPLIDARRRASEARTPHARVRAFDSAELIRALDRSLDRIVGAWPDERPSVRRALRAELTQRSSGYARTLATLAERGSAVLTADEATQLDAWRQWTVQLATTFDAADRAWLAIRSVVEALPPRAKS